MKTNPPSRPAASGSALIITLFFMGMITVVIVGVLISSRLERSSAHSHFDQKRAVDLAREGVERVVATLGVQTAYKYKTTDPVTGQIVYRYRNYLTRPGGLVVPVNAPTGNTDPTTGDASTQNTLTKFVPLSTGTPSPTAATPTDPVYLAPSLNIPAFVQQAELQADSSSTSQPSPYTIDDRPAKPTNGAAAGATTPSAMKLNWVYIHQDPNATGGLSAMYDDPVDPSAVPTGDGRPRGNYLNDIPAIDARYPIIGRFAYWTDDESAKLNYNLAWKKNTAGTKNVSGMGDPSRIDLEALRDQSSTNLLVAQADELHNWVTMMPGRYFNSFEDARQIGQTDSKIPPVIEYNKFELTHYNHDPDTTFFGEDRILLTTNPRLVPKNADGSYARKFIDILREDMTGGKDFRTIDPPDPGVPSNIAGGETDVNGNAVPSGTSYYGAAVTNKLDMVLKNLVRYINQTNWPISSDRTASFQKKYYPGTAASSPAVAQLAMAIIDYVRMRESVQSVVPGTRAGYLPNTTTFSTSTSATSNSGTAYQGYGRYPYCTEMGVVMENVFGGGVTQCEDGTSNGWPKLANNKNQTLYRCAAQYEFYLPVRSNLPNGIVFATPPKTAPPTERWTCTPLQNGDNASQRYVEGEDQTMYSLPPNNPGKDFGGYQPAISTKNCKIYNPSGTSAPAGTLLPGGYAVVTIPYFRVQDASMVPANFALRADLERNYVTSNGLQTPSTPDPNYIRALIVPQSSNPAVNYNGGRPVQFSGGNFDAFCTTMPSVETDDPRCCVAAADWAAATGTNKSSWGAKNTRWSAGKKPTTVITPQQDTDASGVLSDYSLYMPPPKVAGSTNPENFQVTSVGELGYVPTGLAASSGISVPWRTLRLQGSNYPASDVLPDWALADLFAVPNTTVTTATPAGQTPPTEQDLHYPHGNTVGGRVNINAAVVPFTDVTHDRALTALLYNANDPTASQFNTAGGGTAGTPTQFAPSVAETIAGYIANQTPVTTIPMSPSPSSLSTVR